MKRIAPFLVLLAFGICLVPRVGRAKPNILFIMVDEMRWNVMSSEGHPFVKTPNLDRLASQGTRFATTYTCSPVCTPSRYSFFTSRYAHVHGSLNNGIPPEPGQLLLPAILKHHGYETAISGKLHFLPPGLSHGFDFFWSYANEGPGKLPRWPEYLAQKHNPAARQLHDQPYPKDPLGRDIARLAYPKEDMQTFWITDRAVDYLSQRDRQKPFFLFVSYLDPHSPSHLAEPYWSMFDPQKMPAPNIPEEAKQERAAALQAGLSGPGPTRHFIDDEQMARILTAKYYAKVAMVDDNVGRLLKQIEALGLMDDTIIVFTADHGNMLGDRGRWFKGVMYDGSSRIPLIMKAPNGSSFAATFNKGKTVTEIVENTDVMPTLMEMIDQPLSAQPGFQGKSLIKLVAGTDSQWKNVAYAQCDGMMVRTPQYKLVRNTGKKYRTVHSEFELYDMMKDPKEEHDLSADPAHAHILQLLKGKMEVWQQERPSVPVMAGVEKTLPGSDVRPAGKRRRQN